MSQLHLIALPPTEPAPNTDYIPIEAANRLQAAQRAHSDARQAVSAATAAGSPDEPELRAAYRQSQNGLSAAIDDYRAALRAAYTN